MLNKESHKHPFYSCLVRNHISIFLFRVFNLESHVNIPDQNTKLLATYCSNIATILSYANYVSGKISTKSVFGDIAAVLSKAYRYVLVGNTAKIMSTFLQQRLLFVTIINAAETCRS